MLYKKHNYVQFYHTGIYNVFYDVHPKALWKCMAQQYEELLSSQFEHWQSHAYDITEGCILQKLDSFIHIICITVAITTTVSDDVQLVPESPFLSQSEIHSHI